MCSLTDSSLVHLFIKAICALRILLRFWIATLCFSATSHASNGALVFGVPDFPPNSFITAEEVKGFDVEIIGKLGRELNLNIEYVPCNWIRCVELLRLGRIDMLGSFNFSQDRTAFAVYLGPSYTPGRVIFVVPQGQSDHIRKYEDLSGLIVGYEASAKLFQRFDNDAKMQKYAATSVDTLLKLLGSGRIDTVAYNDMAVLIALQKPEFAGRYEVAEFSHGNDGYFALSKSSIFLKQRDKIDRKIRELVANGFVFETVHKYIAHPPEY